MSLENLYFKLRGRMLDLKAELNRAAVAVILFEGNGLELLYVRRAFSIMDPWSGQVAFPGGRCKSCDGDLIDTAIREVYEELGFKLRRDEVIGVLGLFWPLNEPNLKVFPLVFKVEVKPKIKLSREIMDYLWIPLEMLSPTITYLKGKSVEAYVFKDYVIWGLTARITRSLIELLNK